jgi:hypothetical protein
MEYISNIELFTTNTKFFVNKWMIFLKMLSKLLN